MQPAGLSNIYLPKFGANNEGVVYKVDTTGQETVLHAFTGGSDGGYPYTGVILDPAGNLYGTALTGGAIGLGVVFELDASGQETVLQTFPSGSGCDPYAGVTLDAAGNSFGTTTIGGTANLGTVYEIDAAGRYTLLHSFGGGTDGSYPYSVVTLDSAGNLYGTTSFGGTDNAGTIYR
jgi:uncharacterized repeat protein (TIGR03803 family)